MLHLQVIFLAAKRISAYRSHVEEGGHVTERVSIAPSKCLLFVQFWGCSIYPTSRSVCDFQQCGYFQENGIFSKSLRQDT